ncbi:MAG: amidohydrolase [Oscillospiraceae bacterium]|jgi:amidohydrolase|nr:amidohydrolase [Oscillospiraceae bacterium]
MDIMALAGRYADDTVEIRRRLHRNPELSDREFQTLEYIGMKLTEYGVEHIEVERGGILGFIGRGDVSVLLRADIDALPIRENPRNLIRERTVISQNDGVQHACGHDAHTAMLLTAARILKENEDVLGGRVVLLFERGEEGKGNLRYLLRHIIDNGIGVSAAHAIHVRPDLDAGKVYIPRGPIMAGAAGFRVTLRGLGGHGSRPDLANNPVDCFVAAYNALTALRLRLVSPFEPFSFSVGLLSGGEKENIIPPELTFGGSARYYSMAVGEEFAAAFDRILKGVAATYGCEYDSGGILLGSPTINHDGLADLARAAALRHLGADILADREPLMGSESFSVIARLWPSVMVHLGVKNDELGAGAGLHSEYFDLDEAALQTGVAETVAFASEYLKSSTVLTLSELCDADEAINWLSKVNL